MLVEFPSLSTLHICAKKWEYILMYHWSHPLLHYTPFIAASWPFVGQVELERGHSANSSHAADTAIMLCLSCPNDKAFAPFRGTSSSRGVISVLMWDLIQCHLMIFQTINPNKRGLLPTTFILLCLHVIFFFQCPSYFTFASFLFSFSLNISSSLLVLPSWLLSSHTSCSSSTSSSRALALSLHSPLQYPAITSPIYLALSNSTLSLLLVFSSSCPSPYFLHFIKLPPPVFLSLF